MIERCLVVQNLGEVNKMFYQAVGRGIIKA